MPPEGLKKGAIAPCYNTLVVLIGLSEIGKIVNKQDQGLERSGAFAEASAGMNTKGAKEHEGPQDKGGRHQLLREGKEDPGNSRKEN